MIPFDPRKMKGAQCWKKSLKHLCLKRIGRNLDKVECFFDLFVAFVVIIVKIERFGFNLQFYKPFEVSVMNIILCNVF